MDNYQIEAEEKVPEDIQLILEKFQVVFDIPKQLPPVRSCDHRIPLIDPTKTIRARPYRDHQKNEIEKQIKEMLDSGIIRESSSPFASPVVLVKKAHGSLRMCVDYKALNRNTIKDKFPIPLIDDLLDELYGAKCFSKLDLRSGYHQIRIVGEDTSKITFKTHENHYEFLVMPFGLTNAPSAFQGIMNHIFKPFMRKFVLMFFDDILIYSREWKSHMKHVEVVFQILQANSLFAKPFKCKFGCTTVHYLGHIISENGITVDPIKLEAIAQWPQPSYTKALRGFLGLTGYYGKFIKGYGGIVAPLNDMLKKRNS